MNSADDLKGVVELLDALREPLVETALGNYRIVCEDCWRGSRNNGFIEETPRSKEILRVRIKNFRPLEYVGEGDDSDLPDLDIVGRGKEEAGNELGSLETENNATPQEMTKKGDTLEKNELEMAKMATGLSGKKRKTVSGVTSSTDGYDTDGAGDTDVAEVQKKARKKLFDNLEKSLDSGF